MAHRNETSNALCVRHRHCCLTLTNLQSTGRTAEIHCSLHVVVKGSWSFATLVISSYDVRFWSYGASKVPSFCIFAYFSHTKRLYEAYSPGVTLQNA